MDPEAEVRRLLRTLKLVLRDGSPRTLRLLARRARKVAGSLGKVRDAIHPVDRRAEAAHAMVRLAAWAERAADHADLGGHLDPPPGTEEDLRRALRVLAGSRPT